MVANGVPFALYNRDILDKAMVLFYSRILSDNFPFELIVSD